MRFKIWMLAVLLSSQSGHAAVISADVKYITAHYDLIPGSEEERAWKKCDEISPSYMTELISFRGLARDLHNLVTAPDYPGRSDQVSQMRAELKVHSDRLLALARPEWNIENRSWYLKWIIPGGEFFEEPEPDLGWTKLPPPQKGQILGYTAGEIRLLGERRPDLRARLSVGINRGYFRDVEVIIGKEATFLEFCQMARSIEVNLAIDYTSPLTLGGQFQKKFKLIFAEDR